MISAPRRWAARPPSALAAPHSPRPAAPSPRRGGRRLRIRSLAPASLPRGPLTPRAGPAAAGGGGEGEGTSALFVTTESIVCEEPAPAGDRAERGAGGPDGGGARRGERESERGREAGAGWPRSLTRAGRGQGGSEGGREEAGPARQGRGLNAPAEGLRDGKFKAQQRPGSRRPPRARPHPRQNNEVPAGEPRGPRRTPSPGRPGPEGTPPPARPPARLLPPRGCGSPPPPRATPPGPGCPGDGGGAGMDRSGRPRPREGGS